MSARRGNSPSRSCRKRRRAFTLPELVVVMVILTVVALIAQPRFVQYVQRERVRRAATRLRADIRTLQGEAIRKRTPTALGIDADREFYALWWYSTTASKWKTMDYAGAEIVSLNSLGMDADYKVGIDTGSSGTTSLTFDVYGMPTRDMTLAVGIGLMRVDITIEAATGNVTLTDLYEGSTKIENSATGWPDRSTIKATAPGVAE